MELAANIVAAKANSTRTTIATAMLKQKHEAEKSFVNMIEQVAKSAPVPKGQGTRIDITA